MNWEELKIKVKELFEDKVKFYYNNDFGEVMYIRFGFVCGIDGLAFYENGNIYQYSTQDNCVERMCFAENRTPDKMYAIMKALQ